MRASPKVKEALVLQKLSHWYVLAQQPGIDRKDREAAKRNYWKIFRNNVRLAKKHGWEEVSILKTRPSPTPKETP